jgi:hypothetical protein
MDGHENEPVVVFDATVLLPITTTAGQNKQGGLRPL